MGSTPGCVMLKSYGASAGETDELITPSYNLDWISGPKLEFYYTSGSVTTTPSEMQDRLVVLVSTDCGKTWTQRLQVTGTALSNGGYYAGNYYPGANANWTKATVNLPNSAVEPNVRFKFAFSSGGTSNNIFLDDINIYGTGGATELIENDLLSGNFSLQPNPTSSATEIRFSIPNAEQVKIEIVDILGKKVADVYHGKLNSGSHNFIVNENLIANAGLYFVRIQSSNGIATKRLVVER
jgi:hypothetical protein